MFTNDYIRGLCGLTSAELPDSIFDNTFIKQKVQQLRLSLYADNLALLDENNLTQLDFTQLDYMAYKAITLLKGAISLSIPEKVKDNFNEFSRFNNLEDLFTQAEGYVTAEESNGIGADKDLLTLVLPDTDPVTQG